MSGLSKLSGIVKMSGGEQPHNSHLTSKPGNKQSSTNKQRGRERCGKCDQDLNRGSNSTIPFQGCNRCFHKGCFGIPAEVQCSLAISRFIFRSLSTSWIFLYLITFLPNLSLSHIICLYVTLLIYIFYLHV